MTPVPDASVAWPALPLGEWQDTYVTLHRWMQIVGKTRLQFAPMQNHWWNVTLYVTTRGLSTSPMPEGHRSFEVELDFIDHSLAVKTSDGASATMPLTPRSVADFYAEYLDTMLTLGAYPEPEGYPVAPVRPTGAYYHPELHDWIFPYDVQRNTPDPDAALLEFLDSTYSAAANLGHWDRAALERHVEVRSH